VLRALASYEAGGHAIESPSDKFDFIGGSCDPGDDSGDCGGNGDDLIPGRTRLHPSGLGGWSVGTYDLLRARTRVDFTRPTLSECLEALSHEETLRVDRSTSSLPLEGRMRIGGEACLPTAMARVNVDTRTLLAHMGLPSPSEASVVENIYLLCAAAGADPGRKR
jgi:hypothetical protein